MQNSLSELEHSVLVSLWFFGKNISQMMLLPDYSFPPYLVVARGNYVFYLHIERGSEIRSQVRSDHSATHGAWLIVNSSRLFPLFDNKIMGQSVNFE